MQGRTAAQQAREARIRKGSLAPGPRPRGGAEAPELAPGPDETLDRLAGDFCVFQLRRGHRYSTDDLLCAWFALEAAERLGVDVRRALDLGSGIGSVALLLAWRLPEARVDGVEAQAASVGLARRSALWNGVEARVHFREGDLRSAELPAAAYELVTGSPPYYAPSAGTLSEVAQRAACRFELRGGVEAYLAAMSKAVAPGGVCVLVQPWADLGRMRDCAAGHGLALALAQGVIFKEGRPPLIGLYAFQRDPVEACFLEPLLVRRAAGDYSEAYRAVRRKMGFPLERGFEAP